MRPRNRFNVSSRFRAIAIGLAAGVWSCTAAAVDYRVIADQNLFDPQRRPWPEPAAAPASAAAVSPLGLEDIEVQGVVVLGGAKRAIVRLGVRLRPFAPGGAVGRPSAVLSEGQALGSYSLESIEARQLVFVSGGNRFTVPFTRSARRELASAQSAPLPVIQSATLPVVEPLFVPVAQSAPGAVPPQFPPPASSMMAPQPAPAPTPAPAQAAGLFPGGQPTAGNTAAAPASPAAAPASPAGGMTLLQAIQAAEAARRAGQLPAAPAFNPFQPRPQP
jgi:hypothetical protein